MARRKKAAISRMQETGATLAIVTDHAVLRYLERQYGLDVETIRTLIRDICQPGMRYGASGVVCGKGKFVLQDGRVVTFLESHMQTRDLRSDRGA